MAQKENSRSVEQKGREERRMNERRQLKEQKIREKLAFVETLFIELREDFERGCSKQAKEDEKYNLDYVSIDNHTRYANDVVRLRRELLKLWNLLMSS